MTAGAFGLTVGMRDALLVIQELSAGGVPPSVGEIAREIDTSRGNTHRYLSCLRDRGFIAWLPSKARSIAVLRPIPFRSPTSWRRSGCGKAWG